MGIVCCNQEETSIDFMKKSDKPSKRMHQSDFIIEKVLIYLVNW